MPDKKTTIILTNYQRNRMTPTTIKIGTWTEQQKRDFLNKILAHAGFCFDDRCSFSVHFDKSVIHSCMFEKPKLFTPMQPKNKPNELIVEIIPNIESADCYAAHKADCPTRIKSGLCTSWFIKNYIGKMLFSKRDAKQK